MDPEHDLRLLQACVAGAPRAWTAFVRRFAPPLAEVCRRTLLRSGRPSGEQEAQDLLQEVFLQFLSDDRRVLRSYQGKSTVLSYLSAVAVYRVLNDRVLQARPGRVPEAFGFLHPSPHPEPLEILERQESLDLLRREVARLPQGTRLALTLRGQGASMKDVGDALGMSEEAAAQLISRARADLRKRIG